VLIRLTLVSVVVALGVFVEKTWPWVPTIGIVAGICYIIGNWGNCEN